MLKDYSQIQQLLPNHILCIRLFVAEPSSKNLHGLERHKGLAEVLSSICANCGSRKQGCNLVISPLPPAPTNSHKKKFTSVSVG